MKLIKTDRGVVLNVYVKPNSREFRIEVGEKELVIYCKETPTKGKVNKELVKEFSRLFKKKVEIVSGFNSKQKRILVVDISAEEVNRALSACK